jgi:hypothetical protein
MKQQRPRTRQERAASASIYTAVVRRRGATSGCLPPGLGLAAPPGTGPRQAAEERGMGRGGAEAREREERERHRER